MPLTNDIGLDPLTLDLPVFPKHISGVDLIVQRMTIRLQRFLGEWILDTSVGIPYLDFIQTRPVDVAGFGAVIRTEIETTPGVLRVDDFLGVFTIATQTLKFTGIVRLEDDEAVTSEILVPIAAVGNTTPAVIMFHRSASIARR